MLTASSGPYTLPLSPLRVTAAYKPTIGPMGRLSLPNAMKMPCLMGVVQRIVRGQPLALQRLTVAAFQVVSEVRLLGDEDLVLRHELHGVLRRKHGEVAQVMPVIVARIVLQHLVERVHGHRDSGVADGVNSELPAELVALFDVGVDLLRREERPPAKSGLSLVVHQRPGRRAR